MDEHEEHLRVATSFGRTRDDVHSTVSVLSQRGAELVLDGAVDQIAPGEDIRSVRFEGARGYVVTFERTDPLYVLDLADPTQPRIVGELEIPGFSTYMHMLDDTHLLTIGYDTSEQSGFVFFNGVLLQVFDVSDMRDVKLAHKLVIGTGGSSSEALTDHLAFTLFGDKLAVPMSICEDVDARNANTIKPTFSGLMVFDIDVQAGISEHGRVAHPSQDGDARDISCNNLWTDARSLVKRSIFMNDFIYSIAPNAMRVQALDALGNDVAVVPLAN